MARRIVRTKPQPKSAPEPEAPPKKPTPKQAEVMRKLRAGWRIMHGQTGHSSYASGYSSVSFGEMLCWPGQDAGRPIQYRMLCTMVERGWLEAVPVPDTGPTLSLSDLIHRQSAPREAYKLTSLGRTVVL